MCLFPISKCIKYQTSLASTMELYTLLGFMAILRESLKNFLKRGKLMASITLLSLSLHSLLLLANTFSIKPLLNDLIKNTPPSYNSQLRVLVNLQSLSLLCYKISKSLLCWNGFSLLPPMSHPNSVPQPQS